MWRCIALSLIPFSYTHIHTTHTHTYIHTTHTPPTHHPARLGNPAPKTPERKSTLQTTHLPFYLPILSAYHTYKRNKHSTLVLQDNIMTGRPLLSQERYSNLPLSYRARVPISNFPGGLSDAKSSSSSHGALN